MVRLIYLRKKNYKQNKKLKGLKFTLKLVKCMTGMTEYVSQYCHSDNIENLILQKAIDRYRDLFSWAKILFKNFSIVMQPFTSFVKNLFLNL